MSEQVILSDGVSVLSEQCIYHLTRGIRGPKSRDNSGTFCKLT